MIKRIGVHMNKVEKRIHSIGLVPVVVINDVKDAVPTAKALSDAGINCMEITLRTEAAMDAIKAVKKACPDMLVGAGTVLSVEGAKEAVAAGCEFLVSPGFNSDVVEWCVKNDIPITPGCVTPTEIEMALKFDLKILKFFPAGVYGGIKGCKSLYAPYRMVSFIPTGGVNLDNLEDFVDKSYIHAIGGSWLCATGHIDSQNFDEITQISKESIKILLGFDPEEVEGEVTTYFLDRAIYQLSGRGYEVTESLSEKEVVMINRKANKTVTVREK